MSGETKFTSGPWQAEYGVTNGIWWVTTFRGDDVCDLYHKDAQGGFYRKENAEANAHLIAASPDMYEALEAMCDGADDMLEWAALVRGGREALRKARGESQ